MSRMKLRWVRTMAIFVVLAGLFLTDQVLFTVFAGFIPAVLIFTSSPATVLAIIEPGPEIAGKLNCILAFEVASPISKVATLLIRPEPIIYSIIPFTQQFAVEV